MFRNHNENLQSTKKGNVDSQIIFNMMKLYSQNNGDNFLLISGDGDYKDLVDFLISKLVFLLRKYLINFDSCKFPCLKK